MRVIKTMRPGARGTARFMRRYGERPCAVRYRESASGKHVVTTIEIIADEREKASPGLSLAAPQAARRTEPGAVAPGGCAVIRPSACAWRTG